jgi:pyruvate-ferredoxin/flavodoxin oxidoreductase
VFVSLGSAAENIEAAVDYLRETRGVKVGSIHINVIRPFPEAAVVNALKGKKNVIILERTDEALSRRQSIGQATFAPRSQRRCRPKDVRAERDCPLAEVPRFIGGTYGLGSRDFRPEHIIGAYEFATAGRARKDGKTAPMACRSWCSASTILTRW